MKLKERAFWILYVFSSLEETEERCQEVRERDGVVQQPPQAVRRGGEGPREKCRQECRKNISFTPEILILQCKVGKGEHSC